MATGKFTHGFTVEEIDRAGQLSRDIRATLHVAYFAAAAEDYTDGVEANRAAINQAGIELPPSSQLSSESLSVMLYAAAERARELETLISGAGQISAGANND